MPKAMRGEHEGFNDLMRLMEREARMLGLDAPQRLAMGGAPKLPPVRAVATQLVITPETMMEALKALAEAGFLPDGIDEAWVYGPTEGANEGTEPPVGGG